MTMAKTEWPNVDAILNRDGVTYRYYFRTRSRGADGRRVTQRVRMPDDPTSVEFAMKHAELSRPQEAGPAFPPRSFDALIHSYRQTPEYKKLKPRTKKDYERILAFLSEKIGYDDASRWRRARIKEMRDANAHRWRFANYCVQVMSILMKQAIDLEWRTDNPAKAVKLLKGEGEGYLPWPEWALSAVLREAVEDPPVELGVRLAAAIGPRPSDLLALRWSDYDGEGVLYRLAKAGNEVWAPLLPSMRGALNRAKAEARGLTIVARADGQPFTYRNFVKRFEAVRARAGAQAYSLHGLRKNATVTLAEAGCEDREIQAITGHLTKKMVNHYAKGARQKKIARSAIEKVARTAGATRGATHFRESEDGES